MSQPVPRFSFEINKDGKFIILQRELYDNYRHTKFRPGSKGYLVLKPFTKPRSTGAPGEEGNQNGYFHGVVLPISAADRGYTEKELKEAYIQAYAPRVTEKNIITGKTETRAMRDHEMNTAQFSEWLQKIIVEEAQRGNIIPEAHKVEIVD